MDGGSTTNSGMYRPQRTGDAKSMILKKFGPIDDQNMR
jgi:hypothetical protein